VISRPGGGRGDDEPGADIDVLAKQGWWRPTGARLSPWGCALHDEYHLPGAQGQPEGHQGLGRPGPRRRAGDPQPQDLRQRPLHLSRGLGLRAAKTGNDAKARDFVGKLFANVPVFDGGGRGATTTFTQRTSATC
jgi:sulfate transport system substrate-binding protein